ncbi:hypothetical protein HQ346_23355 [Rhodococcus sp. BP-252]|uniref:hypothetical protein n=1 Tax=unclassified Rhodococcus (in: high G+C Gram-positive bacteria) TaxID=192944 RepID=UPI00142FB874|nr:MULTISPECIES: hypothetical protein [unclassified Rhodococcus (in: high G+C Gram-positive bacteria)]MBY6414531.1 hypothetical protein [Rhodococcus sp. BP-320]MBY6419560.1 hypothetical protein [Rhodococcus sp. BP-321]MBY6424198.1 hypothetical protein [Rhodococcus sp. BP-324]MBY6429533.1 hypothetical protein [Rhodococcus sp. BP-323]MBY6434402.1 hypothetical protein [Rhodococcus sp. BP-322]
MDDDFVPTVVRWVDSGGTWRFLSNTGSSVSIALCTCDGGEDMQILTSDDPVDIAWVTAHGGNCSPE